MPVLVDNVRDLMTRRRGRPTCVVCRAPVSPHDEQVRLRGGDAVHLRCATFSARRGR
jgi:hypothetical protein